MLDAVASSRERSLCLWYSWLRRKGIVVVVFVDETKRNWGFVVLRRNRGYLHELYTAQCRCKQKVWQNAGCRHVSNDTAYLITLLYLVLFFLPPNWNSLGCNTRSIIYQDS